MKRFLIYFSHGYSIPIGKPLQAEILKRGMEVKWFSEQENAKGYLTNKEILLNTVKEVLDFNPHIVLVATDSVAHFFPGIKVQVFHGFLTNKWSFRKGHFRIRGFFDLYCTQGPNTTRPFLQLKKKHKYFEIVETGWSKVDGLFPLKSKNQDKKPVIMISSTFTTKYSLAKNEEVFSELKRLSKLDKWDFISVLHPKIDKIYIEKFKTLQNKNFTFYNTTDLIPLYKKADVMLSDTTSAITEFLLQKKPVVTINNNKPGNYMINILKANEIETALTKALKREEELINHIKNFINEIHPYKDGKSSERVINASLNFLENNEVKRKPLNLIRKYKIRKKLNYFKLF